MRAYSTYRHRNCLDIDMRVLKVSWVGPEYIKIRAVFVDRRLGFIYDDPSTEKIKRSELKNWTLV